MSNPIFNLYFEKFPLWKGVASRPGTPEFYPFSLGWHKLGFIYQNTPKAIIDHIIQSYSLDEYQFITSPPGSSSWGNARAQNTIKFILEAFGPPKGASILEIGAGTTYIAEKLVDEYDAASYTIMDPTITEITSYPSIKIIKDYFNLETCPQEAYDLVLSVSTLEHVEDPVIFLRNVQKVLSGRKGKAILFFPDCEKQLFSGDFNVLLHEHLSYFTKNTFTNVARLCNLEIITFKPMYDGLYCMVQSSGEAADNALNQPLKANGNINNVNAAFQESIDYLKSLLNHFIEANQKIAFHGACNGLNNILALSDLPNGLLSSNMIRIFDGDETKAGKYLPMCQMPIINAYSPEYKHFDQIIIAAVSYYDQIRDFMINYHGINPDRIHAIIPNNK